MPRHIPSPSQALASFVADFAGAWRAQRGICDWLLYSAARSWHASAIERDLGKWWCGVVYGLAWRRSAKLAKCLAARGHD